MYIYKNGVSLTTPVHKIHLRWLISEKLVRTAANIVEQLPAKRARVAEDTLAPVAVAVEVAATQSSDPFWTATWQLGRCHELLLSFALVPLSCTPTFVRAPALICMIVGVARSIYVACEVNVLEMSNASPGVHMGLCGVAAWPVCAHTMTCWS